MTKTKEATATAAAAAIVAGGFTFDTGFEIPAATGRGGRGDTSDTLKKLAALPVGASFLETVIVPDTVADAERENVFKEKAKSLMNRLSGTARRFAKSEDGANRDFVLRTVNDDTLGHGVRVWRKPDKEPAAPSAGATAPVTASA